MKSSHFSFFFFIDYRLSTSPAHFARSNCKSKDHDQENAYIGTAIGFGCC
jgi:hypothetical protein